MNKRLNDTKAVAAIPIKGSALEGNESMHISVRPIDNGYIMSQSHYKSDGSYSCKETYSKERPSMDATGAKTNPMKAAVDSLNRK